MLNKNQTTLVVYGAGHRESHLPVFEQLLNPGEMHVLVPEQPKPKGMINLSRFLLKKGR